MPLLTSTPDDRSLWDIMMAPYQMPVLTVAHELSLFTILEEEPLAPADLAERAGIPLRSLEAMADVLVALNLCAIWSGRLHLTALARTFLLPGSPTYWGPMLMLWRETVIDHSRLLAAVRAGGERLPDKGDTDLWKENSIDAEQARHFTAAMNAHSLRPAAAAADTGLFASVHRLLDAGGGSGCFPIALAHRHPDLQATVMDLPVICPLTKDYIAAAGLSARIDTLAADMFLPEWPTGYDAILFSNIFHDWDTTQCHSLARNAFAALPSGGRIFLSEIIKAEAGSSPLTVACYSVDMLLYTEGQQYRAHELRTILEEAGFSEIGFTPLCGYFWMVTGVKS